MRLGSHWPTRDFCAGRRKDVASAPMTVVGSRRRGRGRRGVGRHACGQPVRTRGGDLLLPEPGHLPARHRGGAVAGDLVPSGGDRDASHGPLKPRAGSTGPPRLRPHAGLPGYRWAHQFLDDADGPPPLASGQYLSITLPAVTFRYLGGGLEGLVPDPRVPNVERYRVAAVLAWQRAHGLHLPPPPAPRASAQPGEAALSLADSRARLRSTVSAVLLDTVRVGVSHLSPGIHERLVTTSVWAQGAQYHRLALDAAAGSADQVELLLARSARPTTWGCWTRSPSGTRWWPPWRQRSSRGACQPRWWAARATRTTRCVRWP